MPVHNHYPFFPEDCGEAVPRSSVERRWTSRLSLKAYLRHATQSGTTAYFNRINYVMTNKSQVKVAYMDARI